MFSTLYMPLLSVLTSQAHCNAAFEEISEGHIAAAAASISRWAERSTGAGSDLTDTTAWQQMHADFCAARGALADAEAGYRLAQKTLNAPRAEVRSVSCRNAGWQALMRHRNGVALQCFIRVVDEPQLRTAARLESQCAIAFTFSELGDLCESCTALDDCDCLLASDAVVPLQREAWQELFATLRFDLQVQREVRGSPRLDDHAYWKATFQEEVFVPADEALARSQRVEHAAAAVRIPLLVRRVDHLMALRSVLRGDRDALSNIGDHLDWARRNGLNEYERTTRIETALSLLAVGMSDMAERLLEPLHVSHRVPVTGARELDYLYCMAKCVLARGRGHEALELYKRHALAAGQALRQNAQSIVSFANRRTRKSPQLDDVAARLPAKYRRAYAYMQANLDRDDLSVHELSVEIGVTERALQIAFKSFLGLSPTELIRRERMERIRADLMDNDRDVLGTAKRWGVRSRSALVSGYRKHFNEVPSETLER